MKVRAKNIYLIRINKAMSYMSEDMYVQWATKGPGDRFYVRRGSAGHISISSSSVTILAQEIEIL